MTGTLYGLGIGPGDPELITLKAHRILQSVPVIAYPAPVGADSLARAIVESHLPGAQKEIVISTPMVPGDFPANTTYDTYAAEIAAELDAGQDVAVLCEGDPFFYGSFMYIYGRLAGDYPCQVVPGVSSLGACAAASGTTLTSRKDVLTVLPAPLEESELRRRIEIADSVVIMKVGRHLQKVTDLLDSLGLGEDAVYIEHASMANQRVLKLHDALDNGKAPYFSMILVHKRKEAWK